MHKEADGTWHADLDPVQGVPPVADAPPAPPPAPPSVDPEMSGFALPAGLQPSLAGAAVPLRSRRFGGRRGIAAVGIAVLVVVAKLLLFSGAARVISIATTQTYHAPTSILGDIKSSDASIASTVTQLESGIELPSLQGGHIEGAGYADSQGGLDYMFVLAQDNAHDDSPRPGVSVTSIFSGQTDATLSPISNATFNGIYLDCATATFTSPSSTPPLNVCAWYNANAFGLFVDGKSASLATTEQVATALLTAMTG
jgi:hypothetical protein